MGKKTLHSAENVAQFPPDPFSHGTTVKACLIRGKYAASCVKEAVCVAGWLVDPDQFKLVIFK